MEREAFDISTSSDCSLVRLKCHTGIPRLDRQLPGSSIEGLQQKHQCVSVSLKTKRCLATLEMIDGHPTSKWQTRMIAHPTGPQNELVVVEVYSFKKHWQIQCIEEIIRQ